MFYICFSLSVRSEICVSIQFRLISDVPNEPMIHPTATLIIIPPLISPQGNKGQGKFSKFLISPQGTYLMIYSIISPAEQLDLLVWAILQNRSSGWDIQHTQKPFQQRRSAYQDSSPVHFLEHHLPSFVVVQKSFQKWTKYLLDVTWNQMAKIHLFYRIIIHHGWRIFSNYLYRRAKNSLILLFVMLFLITSKILSGLKEHFILCRNDLKKKEEKKRGKMKKKSSNFSNIT